MVSPYQKRARGATGHSRTRQNLVKTWLETNSKDLPTGASFLGEQALVDLFIKFNTAIYPMLQWSVCSL